MVAYFRAAAEGDGGGRFIGDNAVIDLPVLSGDHVVDEAWLNGGGGIEDGFQ